MVSFSPACDVKPFCLLCSPTFYSFPVAPFSFLTFFSADLTTSITCFYVALFTAISQPSESTDTRIPRSGLSLLLWVCSPIYEWNAYIYMYINVYIQLVSAGSGTINISLFSSMPVKSCVSRLANKLCQVCYTLAWLGSHWTKWLYYSRAADTLE